MYGASIIADMRKLSIQESDPIKKDEGIKIGFTIKKNHVITDRYPYVKTEYFGIYGQGTEKYIEVIDLAIKEGFLVKAGAFIKVPDENGDPLIVNGEKMQWQGNAKFRQYCIDHPKFFEDLRNKISGNTLKDSLENLSEEEVNEIKQSEQELEEEMKEIDDDIIEEAKKKKNKKDKE